MRTGDFSGLVNSAGVLQQLYDPATTQSAANNYARLPFANNQIPISRISPLAKTLYAATPLPTSADNPLVNFNLNDTNKTVQTVPNINTRFDHVFNESNRVYFRYTDIRQFQQALRNYPIASPANIEGGGLPAGATGYQAIPVRPSATRSAGLTPFLPPSSRKPSSARTGRACTWKATPFRRPTTKPSSACPNNFGQTGFPAINRTTATSSCPTAVPSGTTA